MAEFYIGSRNNWDAIQKVAGGSVPKLNQKLAETLRSVAMKQGIKKSQKEPPAVICPHECICDAVTGCLVKSDV